MSLTASAPTSLPVYSVPSALDDVEVGDDVAGVVPDEARASAARHGEHVARPDIAY